LLNEEIGTNFDTVKYENRKEIDRDKGDERDKRNLLNQFFISPSSPLSLSISSSRFASPQLASDDSVFYKFD